MACECDKIKINFVDEKMKINVSDQVRIIPPTSHRELYDLDYENSGHTGFASEEQLNLLKDNALQKNVDNVPQLSLLENRSNVNLYVNINNEIYKTSVKDLLGTKIRTIDSAELPSDWQDGEYIFKKIK